jgi:DGQHR domain-containing protein
MGEIRVKAVQVEQNDKKFFLFKMKAGDLLHIGYFNPRELDRESGIQRPYKSSRSKEIAEYIEEEDSVLPNNIIVSLKQEFIHYSNNGELIIQPERNVAFVIDGQHRLRAFNYTAKHDFELPVSGFVDLSLAEIAEIFVKINYYQKPVSKSLVYDLLGISPDIFPDYFEAHEITKILNETIDSPWFGLIKMLGVGKGIVTQATFISAMEANDILDKVLKDFDRKQKIAILSNYFTAVKAILPEQWGHRGSIISKSIGVHALMRVFPRVFTAIAIQANSFKTEQITEFISPIRDIPFSDKSITSLGGQRGVKTLALVMEDRIFSGISDE